MSGAAHSAQQSTGRLTLHGYFRSSAAFRVRIGLNWKGLTYERAFYHLRKGQQRSPDYLRLNPQGLVPTLERDGQRFTQSLAILEYLDELYPSRPLLPRDPALRAHVRALAQVIACDIHPINNLRVLQWLRGPGRQPEEQVQEWARHWIIEGFTAVENLLGTYGDQFCFGNRISLADVCLVPQVIGARNMSVDLAPFPRISTASEAALSLPEFHDALPQNQEDFE